VATSELRREVARLRAEAAERSAALARPAGSVRHPSAAGAAIDEADIAAAVERWRASRPAEEEPRAPERPATRLRPVELPVDVARLTIPEAVRLLEQNLLTEAQREQLFQELREAGRIDDYVAEIERLAAADPDDPQLKVRLGYAYLQKLFGMTSGPEAGTWAFKADATFGEALALDPENWEARFLKAVSLSNWPPFLGKGPEAIDHFETLIEQQESLPPRPEFAETYLFLGNVLFANGKAAEAQETWRDGLALFPDSSELRAAIERAEKR
jgi:tetratricopeptide (TPR) repeat protein